MRILVVGDGKVGHTLAEHLAREGHDVVIVDRSEEVLQRSEDTLDVLCVRGNGANAATLVDAGADKADIIIAATASDETNMLCCLVAKKLGTKYSIARIRDPEYNDSLTLLQREMGIDMPVNPERATALEISRLLRFPFASNIESFAKGRVEMVEFRAQEHDVVVGHALKDLPRKLNGLPQVLYAAVEREGNVVIPNGDFIIRAGDRVHVAADMVTITSYFRYLGKNSLRVKNVMLLGGWRDALRSEELHWYLALFAGSTLFVSLMILPQYGTFLNALRYGSFQVATIMSTTGYATADFNLWPQAVKALIVVLMFIGSCAGSTAGGIKVVRVGILCKLGCREVRRTFQPRKVQVVRFEGKGVEENRLTQVSAFFFVYMLLVLAGMFLVSLEGLYDLETNFTAVLTCISNVGPGLGHVGPVENFSGYGPFAKVVLSLLMLAGRLELFPILVLFHPSAWRKG